MAIHIPGLAAICVFYIIILGVGIYAAWKNSRNKKADSEDLMLAGRSLGLCIGIFTMTASWVGGGYINGSAEAVADLGILWCQAPIGYSLSIACVGVFFAAKLREKCYTTMLDPFQIKYGEFMAAFLYLPALCGEIFWTGAILNALGATLSVIVDLDTNTSIIISAAIALLYTMLGGLYSVVYTDVIQLVCIFVGLWLSVPFAFTHKSVESVGTNATENWVKSVDTADIGVYIDAYLLYIFGGVPWQVIIQRVLSSRTVKIATTLTYVAAFGCFTMAVPAVLIGIAGASADWNQTSYPKPEEIPEKWSMILPLVLRYLCPDWVAFIGLGAVSAAVMSSTDSAILSSSTMFARNVFGAIWFKVTGRKVSETATIWVMRISQIAIAILATALAITVKSVYYLFYLCSDIVYVILYPQFVCVVYYPLSNTYGAVCGIILASLIRFLGGEQSMGFQPIVEFPWYSKERGQLFPFKTLAALAAFAGIILVSKLTDFLYEKGYFSEKVDIFRCFYNKAKTGIELKDRSTGKSGQNNPGFHPDLPSGNRKKYIISHD
ncbi:high affinity choline transporter 1 [Patella vulgata]|uniref:high affinity choline transporter 1 n=1 Tax=Patella vulgata TaxID=6465 RepID=UPI00218057AF|nr:high affinity choline transporter 1 [Patella vulgata]